MTSPAAGPGAPDGGSTSAPATSGLGAGARTVIITLAAAQFLMTLDSSVMNVSIATVAADVGTTVTGVQTAITAYTLVMASFMITGGKIGEILGRKRAFALGAVIYGCGSMLTAVAPNLGVLLVGWSLLEGLGASLIMPAIVALVATNFVPSERPRAYGLVASSGAAAVAVGPLIGGLFTTYLSWRWVFAGEVLVVLVILALSRRMADVAPRPAKLDLVGTGLSALGLGLFVYGVLRSGTWGFVEAKPGAPSLFGLSAVIWLLLGGALVLFGFLSWQRHLLARGVEPLVDPALLRIPRLRAGLVGFFFQFLAQSGMFFVIPLFLSVALGLSAIETGIRILPLSIGLLVAAAGIPRFRPQASPRRVARLGFLLLVFGIVTLIAGLDAGAGPEVVTLPLLLAGLGVGALSSQLGAITVSGAPRSHSAQVGGLQNTITNLGASIGTALAGAVLVAALTTSLLGEVDANPAVPDALAAQASVELSSGVPFVSDEQLRDGLTDVGVPADIAQEVVDDNASSRLVGLRSALAVLALIATVGLFTTGALPDRQASDTDDDESEADEPGAAAPV